MRPLLVMTVGQTDVQLVVDDVRHEFSKDRCAALHDELKQRSSGWGLVDAPIQKAQHPVESLPEGELLLCTPKLDAVLARVQPTAALLLETCRDAKSVPSDPRFAGDVLEARLKAKAVQRVWRCAYLREAERLEDPSQPRDAVIRRDIVDRIEKAIRQSLDDLRPTHIVVGATGGFPVVTNLVEEIVRLYATVPVEALEIADGSLANPPTADRAVERTRVPEPLVSYQTRRRALELIEKGNLLGAWAMAEPLHEDEVERRWTQVVEWLKCFASSLPMPEGCDIPVLAHKRMAVRAALRVEFALRAGDIPRAVHGTVAFYESALWDHLLERVERSPDPKSRMFRFKEGREPASDDGEKLFRKGDGSEEDRKRPFEPKESQDGVNWYLIYDDEACAGRLAKYFLKAKPLEELGKAIAGVRELRNDVAHNEPTPELMRNARQRMIEAGLWSQNDRFLAQPIIQEVLKELDITKPERLCDNLIDTVRTRLRDHRLDGAPSI